MKKPELIDLDRDPDVSSIATFIGLIFLAAVFFGVFAAVVISHPIILSIFIVGPMLWALYKLIRYTISYYVWKRYYG